ncbi:hypothetical protein SCWH03_02050 [Streptomyces pacificus]|uniref:Uncharacterized protein n=1 Tax=Streptomyces pacificus TaxID=2705029 RepID=A0A6A0AM22_9ACTN|nr:hypothetical protein SCWH03_02050 [Streptomyces pacificus]
MRRAGDAGGVARMPKWAGRGAGGAGEGAGLGAVARRGGASGGRAVRLRPVRRVTLVRCSCGVVWRGAAWRE